MGEVIVFVSKRWILLVSSIAINFALLLVIPKEYFVVRSVTVTAISVLAISYYLYERYSRSIGIQSDLLIAVNSLAQFLIPVFFLAFYYNTSPERDLFSFRYGYAVTSFAVLIVQTMFFAGYESVKRSIYFPKIHIPKQSYSRIPIVLLPLIILIWISRFILLARGSYFITLGTSYHASPFHSFFAIFSDYGLVIVGALFLMAFLEQKRNKKRRKIVMALVVLACEILWLLPTGIREPTVKSILLPILVYVYVFRSIPKKTIVILVIAGCLAFPVWSAYRNVLSQYQQMGRVNYKAVMPTFLEANASLKDTVAGTMVDHVIERVYDGKYLGFLLEHYSQDYEWTMGSTYSNIPFIFIPRLLYHNKPSFTLPLNRWYLLVVGGSVPITLWGEAYINFSWIGIIFIPYFFGLIMKGFDYIFIKRSHRPFWIFFYLYSTIHIIRFPVESLGMWVNFFTKSIIFAFILTQVDFILRKAIKNG